jgi:hypothetical protein
VRVQSSFHDFNSNSIDTPNNAHVPLSSSTMKGTFLFTYNVSCGTFHIHTALLSSTIVDTNPRRTPTRIIPILVSTLEANLQVVHPLESFRNLVSEREPISQIANFTTHISGFDQTLYNSGTTPFFLVNSKVTGNVRRPCLWTKIWIRLTTFTLFLTISPCFLI